MRTNCGRASSVMRLSTPTRIATSVACESMRRAQWQGAGERLEPVQGVLGERTTVVAAALLPFSAADSGNRIDRFVAPCSIRHGRPPVSSTVARRDARYRTACRNRGMTRLGVVSAIAANGIKPFVGRNLVEQFGQDIAVGNVLMRHQRRARHASDGYSRRARYALCATCDASNCHAGEPSIRLRRRPSRPLELTLYFRTRRHTKVEESIERRNSRGERYFSALWGCFSL